MTLPIPDLAQLMSRLDPDASQAQRHLWALEMIDWLRGPTDDVPGAFKRLELLLDAAEARPEWVTRWHAWWRRFRDEVDIAPLLADHGFAAKPAFLGELAHRLRRKLLPSTPDTSDVAELFDLLFSDPNDQRWLRGIPQKLLQRVTGLMQERPEQITRRSQVSARLSDWEQTLVDALTFCVSQISAVGFSSDLRIRMSREAKRSRTFHELPVAMEAFRQAVSNHGAQSEEARAHEHQLRELLDEGRQAAYTVYAHLEEHGISVGIVFKLRQLRERVLRAKELLDCLLAPKRPRATLLLLANLVQVGEDSRSIGALISSSTQLTAAKVAERSAESGEHYITRNWDEYRGMLIKAGGGGALLGFTTWFKFLITGLGLSAFWGGFAEGMNYALAFVVIMLLHFTVATKQPAVTAPAMVAKLKDIRTGDGVLRFVDEVAHLFRSQVAAIVGNLALVMPMVVVISLLLWWFTGAPMISGDKAVHVIEAHHLWGPTLLFAAATGLLLFASSIVAGWVENWFVLQKLDSAIAYNPHITRRLGVARAKRWSEWLRTHVSGLAANVSLGMMLGLVPAIAVFFGIGLEVRHVTLVTGQLAAAVASLGWEALTMGGFWSAVVATLLVGPINLAVSFFLAFRLALKAQGVSDVNRRRIYKALRHRLRKAPKSFLWPISANEHAAATQGADFGPSVPPPAEEAGSAPLHPLALTEQTPAPPQPLQPPDSDQPDSTPPPPTSAAPTDSPSASDPLPSGEPEKKQ